jgi:CRP-like cAMP-binding protein
MNDFIELLNAIYPLSTAFKEDLTALLKEKKLQKKEYLLKSGHVCRNICFIKKGLVRCFYNRGDMEICSWFMKEGDFIISVESFFTQKESFESIQALEDCEMYCIEYVELQLLYKKFPEFNFIGRILTEKYYVLSEQRLYSLRMQRSSERYQFIMNNYPELIQRVPSKYIASYLGVSEETMSRIRSGKY